MILTLIISPALKEKNWWSVFWFPRYWISKTASFRVSVLRDVIPHGVFVHTCLVTSSFVLLSRRLCAFFCILLLCITPY